MAPAPRELREDDVLYRVLRPGEHDGQTPLPAGFANTGGGPKGSTTLSFYTSCHKTPRQTLEWLSRFPPAKRLCATGKSAPSPELMYEKGYRVAALPASVALQACAEPASPLHLSPDSGNAVQEDGHVEVYRGDLWKAHWAGHARILPRDETLA